MPKESPSTLHTLSYSASQHSCRYDSIFPFYSRVNWFAAGATLGAGDTLSVVTLRAPITTPRCSAH